MPLHRKAEIVTWGLKGYLLGTDEFGRDILNRLLNGGFTTMTVGAVAVIISTVLGVILGDWPDTSAAWWICSSCVSRRL